MCTLIVGWRVWPGVDVLVAANRDERLDRPAAPPAAAISGGVTRFTPRDLEAGGTWIGVNEHGVVAALTNRFGAGPRLASPAGLRSRGEIVDLALGATSAREATAALAGLSPTTYAGFHCVVADSETASVVRRDGERMGVYPLAPGRLHAVTERSFGAAESARVGFLETLLETLSDRPEPAAADWAALLGTHVDQVSPDRRHPIDGVCVHLDPMNYGTRSAELIRITSDRSRADWQHIAGRPCVTGLTPVGDAMRSALKW
ncbi:MAG: NRDE family protein [Myxococcota bacterium]